MCNTFNTNYKIIIPLHFIVYVNFFDLFDLFFWYLKVDSFASMGMITFFRYVGVVVFAFSINPFYTMDSFYNPWKHKKPTILKVLLLNLMTPIIFIGPLAVLKDYLERYFLYLSFIYFFQLSAISLLNTFIRIS